MGLAAGLEMGKPHALPTEAWEGQPEAVRLRAEQIRVRALDSDGKQIEFDADGLLAVCIQHEMDHLEGKLFVDYLSDLKRTRIRKKLEKERKEKAVEQHRSRAL